MTHDCVLRLGPQQRGIPRERLARANRLPRAGRRAPGARLVSRGAALMVTLPLVGVPRFGIGLLSDGEDIPCRGSSRVAPRISPSMAQTR